ncbi:hypothetical protein BDW74DRAFT_188571 [Aspergillus multicolor]|uniref:uncharacterized protein n=1 Tax=Aspergillus multicolor TaxID=41759 RepID=UPI003CCDA3BC
MSGSTPSRRPQACERCWKRKQKCDRLFPTCTACIDAKARCNPRQVPVVSSEDSSGLSHAALPGYIESLTQRIGMLEAFSQRKRQRLTSEDADEEATPLHPEGLDSSVQAAMGEIGFLSRSAMAEPREGTSGFPRQLALSEMLQAMLSLSGQSPSKASSADTETPAWSLVAVPDPRQVLAKESAAPFLQHFLHSIGMYHQHFDKTALETQWAVFFDDTGSSSSETPDAARMHRDFCIYLAIAIGMLLSPQPSRVDVLSQSLHTAANRLLPRILQTRNCANLMHCLILLVVYSILSPNGGSAWHLLGLAIKRCIAFGMHKDQDAESTLPREEVAERQYLFWTLYFLDRTICTVMDRPFAIQDDDITLPLPEKPADNSEGQAAFEFHLLLYAKLITSIRTSDERCPLFHYRNVCFWRDTPPELGPFLESNEAARNYIELLSCRALSQILALYIVHNYASLVSEPHLQEIKQNIRSSSERMVEQMYRSLDRPPSVVAFTDGYDIFAAGVAIICIGSLTDSEHILVDATVVNKCVAVLTVLGERFSGIKVFRRVLLALSDMGLGRQTEDLSINTIIFYEITMAPGITYSPEPAVSNPLSSDKQTVYFIDTLHPDAVEHAKTLWNVVVPGDRELNNWREHATAILVRGSYVTADDIARAPNLLAIGKHGVGIDKIDQEACTKRGIKILNTPGANARDVAELVVALTMTVARAIRSITTRQMTAPVPKETCTGLTLHKKTIGVIGMGNIGRTVAEIFHGGFDAKLIAFDAYMPDNAWSYLPHRRAQSLQEVIKEADVITLHIPLTAETRSLISYEQLRQMKPDAILINAARGGIVNEEDLTRVLSEGHLWGAGLDCHEQEPPSVEKYGKFPILNPLHTRTMPPDILHIPFQAVRYEEGLTILASKAAVRQILASPLRSDNSRLGYPFRVYNKHTPKTRMANQHIPLLTGPSRKMSDGGPANPPRHSPKGIFNIYLFSVTWIFALAGVAKGFDEGLKFGIDHLSDDEYAGTKGWIVSIATAGAVFGCLGSLPINDRVGRRWTLRLGTLVYIAGVLGQGLCNGSLGGLYASRIVSGMGIGVTTIVPPVFISEIAPKAIRGLLTLQYAACQQLGVVLGFFINYGVTKQYANTDTQWMLPTLLQLLPAALWGTGTFVCPESPRWLLSVGRREEAAASLSKLRHHPVEHEVVAGELAGMDSQLLHEHESVASASQWQLFKETLIPVENRRRFFLLFMATLFSQWSGANAITQYSPTIFGYLGINGDEAKFLATGIYGIVKFVSTLAFALIIVDFVGRRRSLLTGISLQILTLVFVGAYLGATKDMTSAEIKASPNAEQASTAAIVAIYLHAVAWSIGWFSIPYLIGPEIFPTRIRSLNMSISMALHWAFYFGCSKAMPSLLAATDRWGAFLFFSCICVLGLIYVALAMPDTTGRSLEALDKLFERPWYTMHKVAYASKDDLQVEGPGGNLKEKVGAEHLEAV